MVVHAYSTWEAESEDLEFEDSLGYIVKLVFETKITVEKKQDFCNQSLQCTNIRRKLNELLCFI